MLFFNTSMIGKNVKLICSSGYRYTWRKSSPYAYREWRNSQIDTQTNSVWISLFRLLIIHQSTAVRQWFNIRFIHTYPNGRRHPLVTTYHEVTYIKGIYSLTSVPDTEGSRSNNSDNGKSLITISKINFEEKVLC